MKIFNVIVQGPAGPKKSALIKALSDHVFRSPEQVAIGQKGETYSIEFGRSWLDENTFLYLAGTPMNSQFDFLWERLADNLLGFLIVFDALGGKDFEETRDLITRLKKLTDIPFIVILDGLSDPKDPRAIDLKKELGVGRDERIFRADPADKESAKEALVRLLGMGAKIAGKVAV